MESSTERVAPATIGERPPHEPTVAHSPSQGAADPRTAPGATRRRAWQVVREWLRREPWRSVLRGATTCVALALGYWALAPRTYRAEAIVAPSSREGLTRLPSALSGLAGQLGLNAVSDPTTTPAFYSLLGQSRSIQQDVLFQQLPARPGAEGRRFTWMALLIDRCDSLCILRKGLRKLDSDVDFSVDRQTGTLTVAATLRNPYDAAAVANLYVQAMDRFNRQVRQSQARAGREFLEERVEKASADLHAAEDTLQAFYERNARWQTSPRLAFEEGRLRSAVQTRSALRSELVRQLELARLDEVNSTPLLSVIDSAAPPLWKHSPRGVPLMLAAVVTGALLGLVVGITRLP